MNKTLAERFWGQVHIGNPDECWEWQGFRKKTGYGIFQIDNEHVTPASRMAYILNKGTIPIGLTVDHLCYNQSCCNPKHLEAVTMAENLRRAAALGRGPWQHNLRKTHCRLGHPFSKENTYLIPSGGRQCRICKTLAKQRRRRKQRALGVSARNKPFTKSVAPLKY